MNSTNATIWTNETRNFTIDTIKPSIQFVTPTDTITIDRDYMLINVTASDTNYANVTINLYYSNGTLLNYSNTTDTSLYANFTLPSEGLYYFNATAYDLAGNYNDTETQAVVYGRYVELTKPSRDYGKLGDIPLNYTITDYYNTTDCYYYVVNATNESEFMVNQTNITCTNDVNYQTTFDLPYYGNYTLYMFFNDTSGTLSNTSYTFSTINTTTYPSVNVTAPNGIYYTLLNIPLTGASYDLYTDYDNCTYTIKSSIGGDVGINGVAMTNCDAYNTTFNVALYGNYIIYVNMTNEAGLMTTASSTFTTATAVGAIPTGGGGSSPIEEKKNCIINITPSTIFLSNTNTLQQIILTNRESVSYTPTYGFADYSNSDAIKSILQVTNPIGTVFSNTMQTFGVKYSGGQVSKNLSGRTKLILTSDYCNDITIPIYLNMSEESASFGDVLDDTDLMTLFSEPILPSIPYATHGALFTVLGLGFGWYIFPKRWSNTPILNGIVKTFGWLFMTFMVYSVLVILVQSGLGI